MSFKKHSDLCLINSGIDCSVDLGENLAGIGIDENFPMPFSESMKQYEPAICSEELLGVTNQAGGTVKGKYFDKWYVICTSEQTHFPTNMCDHATNKKPVLEEITH